MQRSANMPGARAVVIGAGMGGLAAAIRLAAAGCAVTVLETADHPGGKARALATAAGPAAMGPTVLTLRAEVDALFALCNTTTEAEVDIRPLPHLARHWWPGSGPLDLYSDRDANIEAIHAFAGPREAAGFARFDRHSRAIYRAFEHSVMRAPRPNLPAIAGAALMRPAIWPALMPGMTLARWVALYFRDPRLQQLFGRYATYVGGRPGHTPAVMGLVWHAEAQGVWALPGGLAGLAQALARAAGRLGVRFQYCCRARRVLRRDGRVSAVETDAGPPIPCDIAVFNGDPRALAEGLLGDDLRDTSGAGSGRAPSLSAWVWSFAASAQGPRAADLAHHNLFFSADPALEFGPIGHGKMPAAPTLYVCAQDRGFAPPPALERFQIILNAPPNRPTRSDEDSQCRTRTFTHLRQMGLEFAVLPGMGSLTRPSDLAKRFPASQGAIYGQSPEGILAAFQRPTAKTKLPGFYLAGGGVHPGAGVPMALLSGQQASAQALSGLTLASGSAPMAMLGGMSMAFRTMGTKLFR